MTSSDEGGMMPGSGRPVPPAKRIDADCRLALLMHGCLVSGFGKMGLGLLRYSEAEVAAVIDRDHAGQDLAALTGISRSAPIVTSVRDAAAMGADTLVPGIAPPGGALPSDWWSEIRDGLAGGMSLVNGLHAPLANHPDLAPLVRPGRWIWDIRQEPIGLATGTNAASALRGGRVVTVGTDMAVGKMTAAIEMDRAARRRGLRSRFLASGQIGIAISGGGMPLDAIRIDFAAGAVERMVMQAVADADLLFLEGQGSALHPASTAWLPLIRGSCPTHLILVHRAGQRTLRRCAPIRIPPLPRVIDLYEAVCAAGGALPGAKVVGVALNTFHLSEAKARSAVERTARRTGLPVTDPVRFGADPLLDAILSDS